MNSELQGIDRPNEVNAYYDEIDDWLTFKEEEKSVLKYEEKLIYIIYHLDSPKFLYDYFDGKGDGVYTEILT